MKWLKYQHKFSSGRSAWQWQLVDGSVTADEAEDVIRELAEEYNHSDKYSGIDYEIVDQAPRWVIEAKLREAGERRLTADDNFRSYANLLDSGKYFACQQCDTATPATRELYAQHGTGTAIKPCPTCGREILISTLPFWLLPGDHDAIKLLGSLVENGKRSVKSKKFRWPVEDGDEEAAYLRLSKLGLVGGSSYQDVREIYATDRGIAEWAKHKESTK